MKKIHYKLLEWYGGLGLKETIFVWVASLAYAAYPPTGLLLGGIPWALYLLYLEYHRKKNK